MNNGNKDTEPGLGVVGGILVAVLTIFLVISIIAFLKLIFTEGLGSALDKHPTGALLIGFLGVLGWLFHTPKNKDAESTLMGKVFLLLGFFAVLVFVLLIPSCNQGESSNSIQPEPLDFYRK